MYMILNKDDTIHAFVNRFIFKFDRYYVVSVDSNFLNIIIQSNILYKGLEAATKNSAPVYESFLTFPLRWLSLAICSRIVRNE